MKNQRGFTLVELMITMVIFIVVIAAAAQIFSSLLNQFKQQSKIVETNIEGVIGLEIMRTDVEQAGYGLAWNVEHTGPEDGADDWNSLANYNEAVAANALPAPYSATPALFNDGAPATALPLPANARRAPRAILGGNNLGLFAVDPADAARSSDYLVVKATSVGTSETSQQWTYIANTGGSNYTTRADWGATRENLANNNRVVVMRPSMGTGSANLRVLFAQDTNTFFTTYTTPGATWGANTTFRPFADSFLVHLVYGVDPNRDLRVPFNRADYYIRRPDGTAMPSRCAPNTGTLYKAAFIHGDDPSTAAVETGGNFTEVPLLDCVADMQVVFLSAAPGTPNTVVWNNADWALTAAGSTGVGLIASDIRDQIRGAYIFILAHEGQRDTSFNFTNFSGACATGSCIRVGEEFPAGTLWGRDFDLRGIIGDTFANYRWKVYTIGVTLYNLR